MQAVDQRQWNRVLLVLLCVLCIFSYLPLHTVHAEAAVQMKVEKGWGGDAKGNLIPVKVTLSSSQAVEGELSIQASNPIDIPTNSSAPVMKVVVPAGGEKTFTLLVPFEVYINDLDVVLSVDQNVVAKQHLDNSFLDDTDYTVGILSDDPGMATMLQQSIHVSKKDSSLHVYPISVKDLPLQGKSLSGINVLVVKGLNAQRVSARQLQAIRQWVTDGGVLLLDGVNQGFDQSGKGSTLWPVQVQAGTVSATDLSAFSTWGTPPVGPLEVPATTVSSGNQVVAQTGQAVLWAERRVDHGRVIYVGYDLTLPTISQWSGNATWWQEIFDRNVVVNNTGTPSGPVTIRNGGFSDQPYLYSVDNIWELKSALGDIPQLKLPSLTLLIIVFAVYLVVVGPIAYYFFRRTKKQTWNWLAIPALSLIVSMGLYLYGEQVRGDAVLLHTVGYIHTDESGIASVRGVSRFISQDANDYVVSNPNAFLWTVQSSDPINSLQQGTAILYPNVPRWTDRDVYVETTRDSGGLVATIHQENGKWVGTVNNLTPYPLKNVMVVSGEQGYLVGDLKAGESKTIQATPVSWEDPWRMNNTSPEYRLGNSLDYGNRFAHLAQMDVVGWTDSSAVPLAIKGYRTEATGLFMVDGTVQVDGDVQGKRTVEYGVIEPDLISSTGTVRYDNFGQDLSVDGSAVFEFDLYSQHFAQINSLRVQGGNLSLYNWQTRTWDPVANLALQTNHTYISPDQRVRVRVANSSNTGISRPDIQVEGSVQP